MEDFSVKKIMPAIIGIALLFVGIIFSKVSIASVLGEYKDVSAVHSDLVNEYEVKCSSQVAANSLSSTKYETINEVKVRHESDDASFGLFMDEVLDWNSYDTYMTAKTNIKNKYVPDDGFMTLFFPNAEYNDSMQSSDEEVATNSDAEESETTEATETDAVQSSGNKIDDHNMKMSYKAVESYLIESVGNQYTYFARVAIECNVDGTTSTRIMTVIYTIDDSAVISNIRGIL